MFGRVTYMKRYRLLTDIGATGPQMGFYRSNLLHLLIRLELHPDVADTMS